MKIGRARKEKPTYCGRHGHGTGSRKAKIRYRTLKDAKRARHSLEERSGLPARIYGCPTCGGYHLTTEAALEWGDPRTVWQPPDRAVSSHKEPDTTEEEQDG